MNINPIDDESDDSINFATLEKSPHKNEQKTQDLDDLDTVARKALIEKIKSGDYRPADMANAIKYLSINNIQNISIDTDELAKAIDNIKSFD